MSVAYNVSEIYTKCSYTCEGDERCLKLNCVLWDGDNV
jgi:hypothetical protein